MESVDKADAINRARRMGNMFITQPSAGADETPERILLDMADMSPAKMLQEYRDYMDAYDTLPIDPAGDIVRLYRGEWSLISGFPGTGKCLGAGTPVMLHSGHVVPVEDIKIGDKLMGPDSRPRTVLSLAQGTEEMYRISPTKGDAYTVNESHILSLKKTGTDDITNICVRDYLVMPEPTRERMKGWRTGVTWASTEVQLDPYFLGCWLGDGATAGPIVYNADEAVLSACADVAHSHSLRAVRFMSGACPAIRMSGRKGAENPIYRKLRDLGITQDKRIPFAYKTNSRAVRLEVLAGLLDTDGSLSDGGFDFISISRGLADDVAFVSRSLGLAAYVSKSIKSCQTGAVGTYWRVSISGDCSVVPTRIDRKRAPIRQQVKDVLKTGISVTPIGIGAYYGFEISGDGLFLLGDFTVTHNTTLLRQTICHWLKSDKKNKVFAAILEQDPQPFIIELAATAAGVEMPTEEQLTAFLGTYGDRIKIWGIIGLADHKKILATVRDLVDKESITHAIIDSMMCLDVSSADYEGQRQFANLVSATARAKRVHIHLVAHPRKPLAPDQEPQLYDVAGASDLGRLAFNVFFVRRGPEESQNPGVTPMLLHVLKQRTRGMMGTINAFFHRKMRQFHVDGYAQQPHRYLGDAIYPASGMTDEIPAHIMKPDAFRVDREPVSNGNRYWEL